MQPPGVSGRKDKQQEVDSMGTCQGLFVGNWLGVIQAASFAIAFVGGHSKTSIGTPQSSERQSLLDSQFVGRVVDGHDGKPIAGAVISVFTEVSAEEVVSRAVEHTVSDMEGFFDLSVPATSTRLGQVLAEGYGPAWFQLESENPPLASPLEVALERPAWLHLYARAKNDRPGWGAQLSYVATVTPFEGSGAMPVGFATPSAYEEKQLLACLAEEAGRLGDERAEWPSFSCWGLPPSSPISFELRLGSQPIYETTTTLRPGSNILDVVIPVDAPIRGRMLTQDGVPVPGWPVGLSEASLMDSLRPNCSPFTTTLTDQSGSFELWALPGQWWIGPGCHCVLDRLSPEDERQSNQAEWVTSFGQWVRLPSRFEPVYVVLSVNRALFIEGMVLRPEGKPASGVFVYVLNDDALHSMPFLKSSCETTTDASGSFRLGPLPAGDYRVCVSMDSSYSVDSNENLYSPPIPISAGSTNVVLKLVQACSIQGAIVDDSSGLPCVASIDVADERHHSAATGWFRVSGIPPGAHDVLVRSKATATAIFIRGLELEINESRELEIRLAPAGRIVLSNKTYAEVAYTVVFEGIEIESDRLAGREESEWVLPPGHVTIRLHRYLDRDARPVTWSFDLTCGEKKVEWWGDP